MRERLVLAGVMCLLLAPSARAQQSGVTYDKDSPAGKQYAIPLDSARRDAAPDAAGGDGAVPLFGAGISASHSGSDGGGSSSSSGTSAGNGGSRRGGQGAGGARPSGPRQRTQPSTKSERAGEPERIRTILGDSASTYQRYGAVIALVIALAALGVGLVVRRGRRPVG